MTSPGGGRGAAMRLKEPAVGRGLGGRGRGRLVWLVRLRGMSLPPRRHHPVSVCSSGSSSPCTPTQQRCYQRDRNSRALTRTRLDRQYLIGKRQRTTEMANGLKMPPASSSAVSGCQAGDYSTWSFPFRRILATGPVTSSDCRVVDSKLTREKNPRKATPRPVAQLPSE